ncbi:MAG: ferrous iron transport protein B [Deltaproteobacteria bacterium]|nr:ferrous iron transport protein B [Deltaproteobacteria bacterium]
MSSTLPYKLHGKSGPIRVALAGNPNSGKTSIFNALTGARQHVGNYPGVTVEKRIGSFKTDQAAFEVLDLPGTYSLSSFSPEERIAQDELIEGGHDVVVVVVDSTTLRRSLVFVAQVMQTDANLVLCMNMTDEADKAGQRIDLDQMQALLGFPVVQTVGHKGIGTDGLVRAIFAVAKTPSINHRLVLGERLETAIQEIRKRLEEAGRQSAGLDWVASRLLIDDRHFVDHFRNLDERGRFAVEEAEHQRRRIESETGRDISLFISERYYGFVDGLLGEVLQCRPRDDARALSNSVDKVLANRVLGLPIFAAVMYAIFWLTFTGGEPPMGWIESGFSALGGWISGWWPAGAESPLRSLLVDGVVGGVGGVIVFLPNILLLFFGLAVLEDTGYMARVAFLMDRVMHRFGLHGKSFVPMMTGFGCSIPGIMATRTLENERDRLTTMLVLPLMSCGARLPIWMLLIPAFFAPSWRAPMLFFIYAFGIVLAFVLALLLRKTVLRGKDAPFVMELPPYRMPTMRAVVLKMVERAWIYLRKAGTVILGISILMWFLTSYPKKDAYEVDARIAAGTVQMTRTEIQNARAAEDLRYSTAGRIGRFLEPAIRPLGFDWKIGTAMIGAFAAKEVFVSQMGIVHSLGKIDDESEGLREKLAREYSPLVGLSLMLFLLVSAPCMATIAVTRRESGRWKWALLQLGGLTAVAYIISLLVFQVGRLVG